MNKLGKLGKSLLIVIAYFGVIVGLAWLGTKYPTTMAILLGAFIFAWVWRMAYDSVK